MARTLAIVLVILVVILGVRTSVAQGAVPVNDWHGSGPLSAGDAASKLPCAPDPDGCCDVNGCAVNCVSFTALAARHLGGAWRVAIVHHGHLTDHLRPDHVSAPPAPPPRPSTLG